MPAMAVSIAPGWTFPGPANDGLLNAAHFESVNVITNSMIEYFQLSAQLRPDIGFGAKPLYLKDTIELGGWDGEIGDFGQWCLQCWEPYAGTDGWDACDDFTRNSSITLMAQSVSVDNQMLSAGIEHPQGVSVAICALAKESGNVPSFTVAYPFIKKEREDGSTHRFSQAAPEGRRNLVPTLRTGERWETVLKPSPRHQMTKRKGGGGRGGGGGGGYSGGGGGGGGGLSTAAIIGIVLGSVTCIVILLLLVWLYRKRKATMAENEKNIPL
ncbi:hypothetical protein K505DRAFT_156656 [Melanomma pulvis-pyrius CBS 109.77]|uniref:Uncharacterized protein n=1 Tax=Melanomma pulvis-pyrius CBS 109.77 TaxID=1314802 RepID=A0A6A6WPE9_9PLEO|nr:hypothetical protein K505DRAFT_156656 [Melanomma pulvis-pyrius CBS 109.77]